MSNLLGIFAATARIAPLWVIGLAMLAACGGGQSPDSRGAVNQPQATDDCDATGAIEGGGRQKFSGVISTVGADGDVVVSNVRFAAAGAKVYFDGASADVARLRSGDVVTMTGTVDLGERSGCATAVFADADITAPIDVVSPLLNTLTLLGQQVRIDADTVFGDDVQPSQLSSLQTGDRIRVTGLYANGTIAATRIDRAPGQDGYFVYGVVIGLDNLSQTFRVNEIAVRYGAASLLNFPTGVPRNGDTVRLAGTSFEAGDPSLPGATVIRPTRVEYIEYATPLAIFPASASVYSEGSIQFIVSGGGGPVTWSILDSAGRTCDPSACGTIDSTGTYIAPRVNSPGHFLVTATSVNRPENSVTGIVSVRELDFPTSGSHTVSGEVFSAETGMIANAPINLWVQQPRSGYSYWLTNGPLQSDGAGRFDAANLPDSRIALLAVKEGYVQPCAVTADVQGDLAVRIEMMPISAFDSFDPPRPQQSIEASASGIVFEVTADGPQPVAGAEVWVENFLGDTDAYTQSDLGGGYFVCNLSGLPWASYLTVTKPGFETRWSIGPLSSTQSEVLDIELKRLQ